MLLTFQPLQLLTHRPSSGVHDMPRKWSVDGSVIVDGHGGEGRVVGREKGRMNEMLQRGRIYSLAMEHVEGIQEGMDFLSSKSVCDESQAA